MHFQPRLCLKGFCSKSFPMLPSTVSNTCLSINLESSQDFLQIFDDDLKFSDEIGRGAFGIVYRAEWLSQHYLVAVKRLHLTHLSSKAEKQFFKELSLMCRLRSPHIINLYGACIDKGKYALVMEYMSLGSLYKILHEDKLSLDWPDRLSIALQTAKSINYLHQLQDPIVHRDIKSLNILVERSYQGYIVKMCDFGLAKTRNETLTQTQLINALHCTLPWTAPEALRLEGYSDKSDIYSLGIVYWELATSKIPYDGHHSELIRAFVLAGDRLNIPEMTPLHFSEVIRKCWSHNPNERPNSSHVIGLIEKCIEQQGNFSVVVLL